MISERIKAKVARATVQVRHEKSSGQGVLVNGQIILTAAHCVCYSMLGISRDAEYQQEIKTWNGKMTTKIMVAEPCVDIAALGLPDTGDGTFKKLLTFLKNTDPVPVCTRRAAPRRTFPVYIYTHEKTWIDGTAWYTDYGPWLCFETERPVKAGTSGGPIVNEDGELVSVISCIGCTSGHSPAIRLALPVWVCQEIFSKHR